MKLRKPFLVAAIVALGVGFLGELGAGIWLIRPSMQAPVRGQVEGVSAGAVEAARAERSRRQAELPAARRATLDRPGLAIPDLALLDGLLLLTAGFIGLALVVPERIQAPLHAIVLLLVSLGVLLGALAAALFALGKAVLMIGMFLAVPFGTIAYLAAWGSFPVGAAAATLGLLLLCKLVFGGCLVAAHHGFLGNRSLVLLTLTSLLANVAVSLLHGFPPGALASIGDAVAAVVVSVFALVWAIVLLVRAVAALVRLVAAARLAVT